MRRYKTWASLCAAVGLMTGCVTENKLVPPDTVPANQVKPATFDNRTPKPDTFAAAGQMYLDQGNSSKDPTARQNYYEQARRVYQAALGLDPKHPQAMLGMARVHEKQGNVALACQQYDQLLFQHPQDASLHYEFGRMLARARQWPQAANNFNQAAALEPNNTIYQRDAGFSLAMAGNFEESAAVFRRSVSESEACFRVAQAAKHVQRADVCRAYLVRALQSEPQMKDAVVMLQELDRTNPVMQAQGTDAGAPVVPVETAPQQ
jgi:tetratricopeptide (TPR) repeat protein